MKRRKSIEMTLLEKSIEMTLLEKITEIQKAVPTFTIEKALGCTEIEFNDLFEKAVVFRAAKNDLELMCICQDY